MNLQINDFKSISSHFKLALKMNKENFLRPLSILKKTILLSLILIGYTNVYAQKYRFFYELKFTPNSIEKDVKKIDVYILDYDTSTQTSLFYSSSHIKNDSINKKINSLMNVSNVTVNLNDFKTSFIKELIRKEKGLYNIYSIIDGDFYTYQQKINPIWKIGKEKSKVLEYNCLSADTSFGGREWKAHFTNELPFNVGPYKFGDLPGIITKIYDTEKEFEFNLIGVTKIDSSIKFNFSQYLKVKEDKYIKQYDIYIKDPVKNMREGVIITDDGTKFFMSGGFSQSAIENEKKEVYSRLSKNNNCIERDSRKCKILNSVLNQK